MRRRVALVVTSEVSARAFYRGYPAFLRSRGWDVTLVSDSTGDLERLASAEGVHAMPVRMSREPSPLKDLGALRRMRRALRRLRPDVVVTATPKAGLLGMLAARSTGVPVRVHQLWGLRLETERGFRRQVFRALERLTADRATLVIANSRSLADAADAEGIGHGRIEVVGPGSAMGIDLDLFSASSPREPLDAESAAFVQSARSNVVGFVGRLTEDKGIPTLLQSLEILQQRGVAVAALLVGTSESEAVDDLVTDTATRVRIHRVSQVADPRAYLAAMDVFCLPTLREGFPNVILEAAALGIPAVTTTATGARDSVIEGKTGLLVPPLDARLLADALERVLSDTALRRSMGAAAAARVHAEFDRRAIWIQHEELIAGLLSETRG